MKIVVLTKSPKRMNDNSYGNCVAGLNEQGEWVRLVSDVDGQSLSDKACSSFGCLDVIDVEAVPCPIKNQPENYKLEKLIRKVSRHIITDVIEEYGVGDEQFVFVNSSSTLTESERRQADASLMIIKVNNLIISLDNRNKSKAQFTYNNTNYQNISVTDNRFKKPIAFDEAFIVVSLPSETDGFVNYYKFIAAVYPV